MGQVQQLEMTIVVLHQQRVEGQRIIKEPKISIPAKFDGSRTHFRVLLNQVVLVIQMHLFCYSIDASRVGYRELGQWDTLLIGITLSWFAPLIQTNSPLLNNFEEFIKEFRACFRDTDGARTTINKICTLRQGDQPISTQAINFHPIASDIPLK